MTFGLRVEISFRPKISLQANLGFYGIDRVGRHGTVSVCVYVKIVGTNDAVASGIIGWHVPLVIMGL